MSGPIFMSFPADWNNFQFAVFFKAIAAASGAF